MKTTNYRREVNDAPGGYGMADDEIVIERREIVARISLDPFGTRNPLEAAYSAIGSYFAENDAPGTSVEFVHFGRTFRAGIDPVDPVEA